MHRAPPLQMGRHVTTPTTQAASVVKPRRGRRSRKASTSSSTNMFFCPSPGCSRSFDRRYNLKVHMRMHDGVMPYACSRCDRRFRWRTSLQHHQRHHARADEQAFAAAVPITPPDLSLTPSLVSRMASSDICNALDLDDLCFPVGKFDRTSCVSRNTSHTLPGSHTSPCTPIANRSSISGRNTDVMRYGELSCENMIEQVVSELDILLPSKGISSLQYSQATSPLFHGPPSVTSHSYNNMVVREWDRVSDVALPPATTYSSASTKSSSSFSNASGWGGDFNHCVERMGADMVMPVEIESVVTSSDICSTSLAQLDAILLGTTAPEATNVHYASQNRGIDLRSSPVSTPSLSPRQDVNTIFPMTTDVPAHWWKEKLNESARDDYRLRHSSFQMNDSPVVSNSNIVEVNVKDSQQVPHDSHSGSDDSSRILLWSDFDTPYVTKKHSNRAAEASTCVHSRKLVERTSSGIHVSSKPFDDACGEYHGKIEPAFLEESKPQADTLAELEKALAVLT